MSNSNSVRTVVTFESQKFNVSTPHEYFINPNCFGDDLCKWLIAELKDEEVQCDSEPGQEDFGWYFNFIHNDVTYCLVCGYRPNDENDSPGLWVGWVERSAGFFSSLFGGRNKKISASAPLIINRVLMRCPEISNIRWHLKEDFDRGIETGV